ncbi:hypothetical protein ACTXT7_000811 [Hymenolepis weldensis]
MVYGKPLTCRYKSTSKKLTLVHESAKTMRNKSIFILLEKTNQTTSQLLKALLMNRDISDPANAQQSCLASFYSNIYSLPMSRNTCDIAIYTTYPSLIGVSLKSSLPLSTSSSLAANTRRRSDLT